MSFGSVLMVVFADGSFGGGYFCSTSFSMFSGLVLALFLPFFHGFHGASNRRRRPPQLRWLPARAEEAAAALSPRHGET